MILDANLKPCENKSSLIKPSEQTNIKFHYYNFGLYYFIEFKRQKQNYKFMLMDIKYIKMKGVTLITKSGDMSSYTGATI